ncbi:MAG: aminodeoxychorismate synthase component I [Rhizobiales bacterium]|nr:aminodeoxychorismate synthase component I [Hyphomicrobiales bacterium]
MNFALPQETAPEIREVVYREPAAMAQRAGDQRHATLFESALRQEHLGRYSFLACNPAMTFEVRDGRVSIDGREADGVALGVIDRLLAEHRMPHVTGLPPFQGGFAGYFAYEFGKRLEPGAKLSQAPIAIPEVQLHLHDAVIAFDHMQERAFLISTGRPEHDEAKRRKRAAERADEMEALIARNPLPLGARNITDWKSNFTRDEFEKAVARTVEYILDGDIFQANIAQCFSAKVPEGFDAFSFYRHLRDRNPAPFAAYLDCGPLKIVSSSPERLFNFDGQIIEARPIKGTRRRDADPSRDATLIAELTSSRKDRAENVMIVDLLRNDLSRVAKPGTVRVPVLCGLETYASVHHLTSVVTAEIRDGKTAGDLIAAAFPGGSITGAPKIRAMEVIEEIERKPRGVYCGSIGWLGFSGHMDLNIAIRTVQFADGVAQIHGGGGITARSNPAEEYDETIAKVARIMEAFAA